ncbi:MAG: NAD-dependent epimerase/dehydratase family protein [Deltaproteobacteria bacterium]|nr:NAD-dependent epimerase/dehydratase family protein [Deltaproteobacteria bacterium]
MLVLGATGFVGKRVVEKLQQLKPNAEVFKTSLSLGKDLRNEVQTSNLFENIRPDYVINCAAYVGGIQYGYIHPAEIYYNNMRMILNIFEACKEYKVKRLIQPISNCAYPANESFFKEEDFWSGPLHESVLAYGMTRKMMWVGAWAYAKQYNLDTVSLILSNMYGPGDHFDEVRSHALGALVKKIVDAKYKKNKEVVIWGTGSPVREWLYVEDGAEALGRAIDIMPHNDIINVGVGYGISIKDLANIIKGIVEWDGEFVFDATKPDGAPFKTVEGSKGRLLLGWVPQTDLKYGIRRAVDFYVMEVIKQDA